MKTIPVLFICLLTLLIGQPGFGQGDERETAICGVEFEQLPCNLLRYPYLNAANLPQVNIGVAVHIVRYDDGTGGYSGNLQAIIDSLNQKFVGSRMHFVLDHVRSINSSYFADIEEFNQAKEDQLAGSYN